MSSTEELSYVLGNVAVKQGNLLGEAHYRESLKHYENADALPRGGRHFAIIKSRPGTEEAAHPPTLVPKLVMQRPCHHHLHLPILENGHFLQYHGLLHIEVPPGHHHLHLPTLETASFLIHRSHFKVPPCGHHLYLSTLETASFLIHRHSFWKVHHNPPGHQRLWQRKFQSLKVKKTLPKCLRGVAKLTLVPRWYHAVFAPPPAPLAVHLLEPTADEGELYVYLEPDPRPYPKAGNGLLLPSEDDDLDHLWKGGKYIYHVCERRWLGNAPRHHLFGNAQV